MLNSLRPKNINCDEAKFTQGRILLVEKNLADFCDVFGQYSRKIARVRDKGDAIVQTAVNYANSEEINKSLSNGLTKFASIFSVINDYGDARVQYIDSNVVNEFSQYENICKQSKEETKHIFNARDKEMIRKKHLDRIRERNPRNRQQIIQAETELVKATAEVSRTIHSLKEKITAFERQKLRDIKILLLNFISIEMGYHAKALEQLTKAYQSISEIDEEVDLQAFQAVRESKEVEFKKSLRNLDISQSGKKQTNSPFRTSQSLGSINTISSSSDKNGPLGIPAHKNTKRGIYKSAETLDSINDDLSETSESNSDQEYSSENSEQSQEKPSPFIAKKYLS